MLEHFTLILICQLIGELIVAALGVPFPGPVIGMVLLFIFLLINRGVPEKMGRVGSALLNHLSLLFVPAGVGVMAHFEVLKLDFVPLSVAMFVSTLFGIVVTAWLMVKMSKQANERQANNGEEIS